MITLNTGLDFDYNPFGGLTDDELMKVIVPKKNIGFILADIKSEERLVIELVGKKGRGKTSHLKLLHRLHGAGKLCQLTGLNKLLGTALKESEEVLFVDSVHHLNIFERLKLFKSKRKIILTTHHSKFLEYKMANSAYKSYRFEGISKSELSLLLKNRITLAAKSDEEVIMNEEQICGLIDKHKDDYRGILKELYHKFESL